MFLRNVKYSGLRAAVRAPLINFKSSSILTEALGPHRLPRSRDFRESKSNMYRSWTTLALLVATASTVAVDFLSLNAFTGRQCAGGGFDEEVTFDIGEGDSVIMLPGLADAAMITQDADNVAVFMCQAGFSCFGDPVSGPLEFNESFLAPEGINWDKLFIETGTLQRVKRDENGSAILEARKPAGKVTAIDWKA